MNEGCIDVDGIIKSLGADGCKIIGDRAIRATAPTSLMDGLEGGFSFHDSNRFPDFEAILTRTRSNIVITNVQGLLMAPAGKLLVIVDDPRNAFVKVIHSISKRTENEGSVHPTSVVDPNACLHDSVIIGPGCVIGSCTIGKRSVIEAGVVIASGVRIGENVRIKAHAVLGNDGFSFERDVSGELMRFPHFGGIVIEEDVEIGSGTVIDKGTFGNTTIGRGTKIDNLCHIAHNVRIGRDCLIIAHSVISGSDKIGDRVWIAPGSILRDGISVGDDAFIGIGAVVIKDVDAGEKVFGNPARPMLKK